MAEITSVHAVDVRTPPDGGWWRLRKGGRRGRCEIGSGGETAKSCVSDQSGRTWRRLPVHDLGVVEAECERVRSALEADNEFPVAYVVGLDREPCRLFGRAMLLELEADPAVRGPHAEAVFLFVHRGRTGPVDNIRHVLGSVMKGHDVRIVHRHVLSSDARPEAMDRAGLGVAIAKLSGREAHPGTGSRSRSAGKPRCRERGVRRVRRRGCAAVRRRRNGANE